MISRPFFTPRKMRMHMNLDHVANGHFVLGRGVLCEFDYWPLAVCLQRRYARCPLLIRFHPVIIILALLRRGFGTSVPLILIAMPFHKRSSLYSCTCHMLVIVVYMNCELVNFKFSLYNYVVSLHALSLTWRLVSAVKFPTVI